MSNNHAAFFRDYKMSAGSLNRKGIHDSIPFWSCDPEQKGSSFLLMGARINKAPVKPETRACWLRLAFSLKTSYD